MRILVTGSRGWRSRATIAAELAKLGSGHTLAHGGARGADRLAGAVAAGLGWSVEVYPANWPKYGRSAGMIRNRQMLEEFKPDLVVAFWDGSSRGTANMIELARSAGVKVQSVQDDGPQLSLF